MQVNNYPVNRQLFNKWSHTIDEESAINLRHCVSLSEGDLPGLTTPGIAIIQVKNSSHLQVSLEMSCRMNEVNKPRSLYPYFFKR